MTVHFYKIGLVCVITFLLYLKIINLHTIEAPHIANTLPNTNSWSSLILKSSQIIISDPSRLSAVMLNIKTSLTKTILAYTKKINGNVFKNDWHQVKNNIDLKSPPKNDLQKSIIIVIDPGHGGKDTGGKSLSGLYEKDVALEIAKQLNNSLSDNSNIKVVMTRIDDRFLSLQQRLRIAKKENADAFISIHADKFSNPHAHGASIYVLKSKKVSRISTRMVAKNDYYPKINNTNYKDKNKTFPTTLVNSSPVHYHNISIEIADKLLDGLSEIMPLHHNQVKQASFVVLKSTAIPSILIEAGFISNEEDEKRLTNKLFQQKIANTITKKLQQHFKLEPL